MAKNQGYKMWPIIIGVMCAQAVAEPGLIDTAVTKPSKPTTFAPAGKLKATLTRTNFGIAHVRANDLESLAFGNAYAQAQDHACLLADSYLKVRGERARFFGPDAKAPNDQLHVASDFLYKTLRIHENIAKRYATLSDTTKALSRGFAAGYNRFLQDVHAGKASLGEECQHADWVRPIQPADVLAHVISLGVAAPLAQLSQAILTAHPATSDEWMPRSKAELQISALPPASLQSVGHQLTLGSNGWALGRDKTTDGRGLLLANPHFPLRGAMRFWSHQAQIPGQLNVMGASIIGVPAAVNIGFNQDIAWTHTYSAASTSVIYQLKMGDTEHYLLDGKRIPLRQQWLDVDVKTPNGVITLTKPVYQAEMGLVVEIPGKLDWTAQTAYALQLPVLDDLDILDHWLALNRSTNLADFKASFAKYGALMFNNTLYTDKQGNTFYIDSANVPALPEVSLAHLRTDPVSGAIFAQTGMAVVPGHSHAYLAKKRLNVKQMPQLERLDYVQNSNDSYWLTNPAVPLQANSLLYGETGQPLSLRTRYSLELLTQAGADGRFDASEVEAALVGHGAFAGRFKAELATLCPAWQQQDARFVPICGAIAKWDGQFHLQSKSAHLIREFVALLDLTQDFAKPFDSADPLKTPNQLNNSPALAEKMRQAAKLVEQAGFALDAPLGSVQFYQLSQRVLPWAGAMHLEGGFNVFAVNNRMDQSTFARSVEPPFNEPGTDYPLLSELSSRGYDINFGSSWMMVVDFEAKGPKARGLLTHSQSTVAGSAHQHDQTEYYQSHNQLIDLPFTEAEVAKTKVSEIELQAEPPKAQQ